MPVSFQREGFSPFGGSAAPDLNDRCRVLVTAFACCPPEGAQFTGGEDLLGWNLVKQIARFHEVSVLTHALTREDIERTLAEEPLPSARFVYVGLPRWLQPLMQIQGGIQVYSYFWQLRAYIVAKRLHREHAFDLAHHVTYANDWMASFIGALLPVPYVRGPGGGAHQVPKLLLREYQVGGRLWEWVRGIGQQIFRCDPFFIRGQARARALLVCNREAWDALPRVWQEKAVLFPVNGIGTNDIECLRTEPAVTPRRPFRVLSAGKLMSLKGFSLAIKAFKRFSEGSADVQLEIIGDGPDEPRLFSLIESLGLGGRAQLLPWKRRTEFLRSLAACDVFLFPSLRDGGGAVVIEAMAAGKPVVCLDLGGPGLHVTEERGMKVKVGHPEHVIAELAGALERLYHDHELRRRMGEAARRRAEMLYRWDRLGERLRDIYRQALKGEAGSDSAQGPYEAAFMGSNRHGDS